MIPRIEFFTALNLAIQAATASAPDSIPRIAPKDKPGLECVCFDFWPGDSMRVVGTNGRYLAATYLRVNGLPTRGHVYVPLNQAQEALTTFSPALGADPVDVALFGLEQMIVTSGASAVMLDSVPNPMYPDYHTLLADRNATPSLNAAMDGESYAWMLREALALSGGMVYIGVREYGLCTVRPRLRPGMQCIHNVILGAKPVR